MQVASMVRIPGRDEYFEAQFRHQQHQQQLLSQRRNTLVSTPYTTNNTQSYGYTYQPQQQRVPTPPSPPSEELGKPSLPSISSLLGIADDNQTAPQQQQQQQQAQQQQFQQDQQQVMMSQSPQYHHEQLPSSVGPVLVSHPKMTLPPTPPLGPESLENAQSPSTISSHSMVSAQPYYMGQPQNSMMDHRHSYSNSLNSSIASSLTKRPSIVSQPATSPYTTSSPYVASPYGTSSSTINSAGPYYQEPQMMGMYAQRPLPSNFPPPMTMPLTAGPSPSSTNPWQHHHYISASSAAAFPQSQDRYICQTCNKAFSRPSSLRIHSHSHTGEKPFKCSHAGCGKAFSVRSNMKRHERGCHASTNSMGAPS